MSKKIVLLALLILAALTLDVLRQGVFAWMGVHSERAAAASDSREFISGTSGPALQAGTPGPSASDPYPPPDPSKLYLPLITSSAGQ